MKKDTAHIFLFRRCFSGGESLADVVKLKEKRDNKTKHQESNWINFLQTVNMKQLGTEIDETCR